MTAIRVESFTISLDGYGAGPAQSLQAPLGVGGERLHAWALPTRTFQEKVFGKDGGEVGPDDDIARRGFAEVGAWVMGRNMFAPSRGPWTDDGWKGWWGPNPTYHTPVFVLTHHARPPLEMEGGTTFHFVTDGIERAVARAREAARGKDVRIGGGAATIRAALAARLVDTMHVAVSPILLGRGEPLLAGLDLPALGYEVVETVRTARATHVVFGRTAARASP